MGYMNSRTPRSVPMLLLLESQVLLLVLSATNKNLLFVNVHESKSKSLKEKWHLKLGHSSNRVLC